MKIEAPSLLESAWLPTSRVLEPYNWLDVFGSENPVELELGSGDGGFILERARRIPECNFLAVERLMGRARKIVKRTLKSNLTNLKTLRLESSYVVEHLCPPQSISVIHIMFPDPWPKKKHHKRRLIQDSFLDAMKRALIPGGTVRFSTDHEEYFQWALEIWNEHPDWKELDVWNYEADPLTEFQQLWNQEGRKTFRTHRRVAS
ncbi:MAG: tRNA (guanosine(46)-N7)-methyltransferase TrmB [Verrucomicrobiota bacterium]